MIQELSDWEGQLVLERVEDGMAHIELVSGSTVEKMVSIDTAHLADDHFHDGMVVAVEGGEIVPLERESAERERYAKEKVEKMGKRVEDIDANR
jgi:hypothetical protein